MPGTAAHVFNPGTQEAEAGGSLSSRPGLHSELQDNQDYIDLVSKQTNKQI